MSMVSERKRLIMLLATLLMSGTLIAAPAGTARKAKSRTIKQLIELTLEKGGDKNLKEPMSTNLGFASPPTTKVISYDPQSTPDSREHQFYIVFGDDKKPSALIWGNTLASIHANATYVDGLKFRTTLDGRLKAVVHSFGRVGEVEQVIEDIKNSSIKDSFEREREFFLKDAIPLD